MQISYKILKPKDIYEKVLKEQKKNGILQLTRSKFMALTSEQGIAADNGMLLTHCYRLLKKC